MHSSDLRVKDDWMKHYDITLRNLMRHFRDVPQMAKAEQQINEMLRADLSIQVHGLDQTDFQTDLDSVEAGSVRHHMINTDLIGQWEAELLQERLEELNNTDDANILSTEQLRDLRCFFEANKDLGERFSDELQNINSLKKCQ